MYLLPVLHTGVFSSLSSPRITSYNVCYTKLLRDPISLDLGYSLWEWARIYTTIDRNIQKKVEDILETWVKQYRANKWTVVIMDPKTWAVIAMANYPTYDLNNPGNVYELEKVSYAKYPDPLIDLRWYPVFVVDSKEWVEHFYNWEKLLLRDATEDELWNSYNFV